MQYPNEKNMEKKKGLMAMGESLDVMELMEVKGGADPRLVCIFKSAVKCEGETPAVVHCSGTPATPPPPPKDPIA